MKYELFFTWIWLVFIILRLATILARV